jgi:hypothetical protein
VAEIEEFKFVNFRTGKGPDRSTIHVDQSDTMFVPQSKPWHFPMKPMHDKAFHEMSKREFFSEPPPNLLTDINPSPMQPLSEQKQEEEEQAEFERIDRETIDEFDKDSKRRKAEADVNVDPEKFKPLRVPYTIWEKLREYARVDTKSKTFQFTRKTRGPDPKSVYARTTINLDTGHILEERAIMLGKSQAELHAPLPSHYGHKLHSRLKTILYYDPNWQKPSGRFVDGRWTRYYAGSTNPGVARNLAIAAEKGQGENHRTVQTDEARSLCGWRQLYDMGHHACQKLQVPQATVQ